MNATATHTESGILADAVRDANAEVIEFVEGCSSDAWARRTAEEGWTMSMAAAHIAIGHLGIARWLHRVASGQDITETPADWEVLNASDARYNSELSPLEVVERLRVYGAALERYVRDLRYDQLTTSAMWLGRAWTTAEITRDIAIGHTRGHLAHLVDAAKVEPSE
ncbi:MAG TPA: DinB family protein [Acidimicrobiales bacterium]|nr:DinB family protein [Acidimicrobiales bacterium]